ncbi:DNA repair protein RecO [Candidatus Saccharibacteria bacterium]|nr:DNA repair protein RecO [Candidatus Saccharibacteria bacterium]
MRAIVLRRTNYGEADRILQLITPTGKYSVIARGARREKSRLSGGIELFAVCEVVIQSGKGDLDILTSARLVQFYQHILENYDRMTFGYLAIKLIARASEMLDEPEWYDLLAETLAGLDVLSIRLELIQAWFYMRYSQYMGYELSLWHDVSGNELSSDISYRYDVGERGFAISNNGNITADHIKLLRLIAVKPLSALVQIGGIGDVITDCMSVSREHAAV